MLRYSAYLRNPARDLRRNLTESEQVLWHRLRAKQILGIQFYRQKPLGQYLSDLGLKVLRFDSRVVLTETDAVMEVVYKETKERLGMEIPPNPPLLKGGVKRTKGSPL